MDVFSDDLWVNLRRLDEGSALLQTSLVLNIWRSRYYFPVGPATRGHNVMTVISKTCLLGRDHCVVVGVRGLLRF